MNIINIDGKEYAESDLSEEVKANLASLHFVDLELQRLNAQSAMLQTARIAYGNAINAGLPKKEKGKKAKK